MPAAPDGPLFFSLKELAMNRHRTKDDTDAPPEKSRSGRHAEEISIRHAYYAMCQYLRQRAEALLSCTRREYSPPQFPDE